MIHFTLTNVTTQIQRTKFLKNIIYQNWNEKRKCEQSHNKVTIKSETEREICSVVSNSLPPHGLYSPLKNNEVGSLSLLQDIFPTQGLNPGLPHCRQILYKLSLHTHKKHLQLHVQMISLMNFLKYSRKIYQSTNQEIFQKIEGLYPISL